jgi:copper homeostasis protein
MIKEKITLEVCVDSLDSALVAEEAGADRLELCANLAEGGTTPSYGLIELVKRRIKIPVHGMVRPRRGDFVYSDHDFEVMKSDIRLMKEMKMEGVVFGILLTDSTIDASRLNELVGLSRPMKVVFHRAFDLAPNPAETLSRLIELKFDKILTSGGKASAYEGADLLATLVEQAKSKISIMPGGGLSGSNIGSIREKTKATEFHISGKKLVKGKVNTSHNDVFFGIKDLLSEHDYYSSDYQIIKNIKDKLYNN